MMDKVFDNNVRKYVNKSQSSVLSVTFRNNQIVLNGESQIVEFVSKSNSKEVTLEALFSKIQDIEQNKPDPLIYATATPMSFPLFPIKFKCNLWNWKVARAQMGTIMKVLGFKRGNASEKTYSFPEHQPQGWPDAVRFKKPKFATKDEANMVIESILRHHGIDPYSHHISGADGGNAALSRETVDSSDNEEHVDEASNDNGTAFENRDNEEATAAAASNNNNNNNNNSILSDIHVNNALENSDNSEEEEDILEEEDIMRILEEDDREGLSHESGEESEEDEVSEQNVHEDDDDNGNEELSPYEKIREENIRRRKEEEQQSLKDLFAAKEDLKPTQKPKKALKRKLSAPGPTTMSLRTRKKQ